MSDDPRLSEFNSNEDWLNPRKLSTIFGPTQDRAEGARIFVGISGGIAVYKVCTVVSRLAQAGAQVTVAMTQNATNFVTPLTFQALSGNPVYTSPWEHLESSDPQHISLADRSDAVLIAPCTMNTLSDIVHARTSSVVTLILSAINREKTPVLIAPAMNDAMWSQPANLRNVEQAQTDGNLIVGPGAGWQACRHDGTGRMSEPEDLIKALGIALIG
jgi:phosphopantothenoylcysteine decarboxylase / phosphopantothenate---cysteine ligase